jgi:Leucine-rich repeat (LRR) protein
VTTLEELSCAQNRLTDLCSNIDDLTNLRKLNLFGNPIKALPRTMQRLSNLEFLNLWDVPFTEEPTLLYDMHSLQIVGVNTPDDHPSPDIIRLMRQELSGRVQFMDPDI